MEIQLNINNGKRILKLQSDYSEKLSNGLLEDLNLLLGNAFITSFQTGHLVGSLELKVAEEK